MANSSAAKNLAMLLATKTYKGIKSIGNSVRRVGGKVLDRIENVEKQKEERNRKIIEENWGNVDNYTNIK